MKTACLTVDMEQDCPPYLTSYRGVEEGTPRLLALLRKEGIKATFFTTGDIARRFPRIVAEIVAEGHELGCNGDTHRDFCLLCFADARREIAEATAVLRQFSPCISFRAPYLRFPRQFLPLLEEYGYRIDSSVGRHKVFRLPVSSCGMMHIPASTSSAVIRLPRPLRFLLLGLLKNPVVLFVHPWEFVDFRRSNLRLDCRFRTGDQALSCLAEALAFLRRRRASFQLLRELAIEM